MPVYQDKAIERIKGGIKRTSKTLEKAKAESTGEADTRTIVMDTLVSLLGWDKFRNLTAESNIGGGYADILIKRKDKKGNDYIYAVIEIKRVGLRLNESHLRQARDYARNEGIPWVFLTNGNDWKVYNLEPTKRVNQAPPEPFLVLSVTIDDVDMKPQPKSELLYLLSEEASRREELEQWCHSEKAVSGENLVRHILSQESIDKIRILIKRDTGVTFANKDIARHILDRVVKDEVLPERPDLMIRRCEKQ